MDLLNNINKIKMENLLTAILCYSFIFCNKELTIFVISLLLLFRVINLNYKILSGLSFLTTFYLYGFMGVLYSIISFISLFISSVMYWYDLSLNEIIETIKRQEVDDCKNIFNSFSIKNKMTDIKEYKQKIINKFKNNKIIIINNYLGKIIIKYYIIISDYFNKLCDIIYVYMCKFREITIDIIVFKNIYYTYDKIYIIVNIINSIKNIHKISRETLPDKLYEPVLKKEDIKIVENLMENMFKDFKPDEFMKFISSIDKFPINIS